MPADEPPDRAPHRTTKKATPALFGSAMGDVAPYLGLGIEIMISMVLFVLLGYFADRWLDTSPWLLIVGSALGMVATGLTLWRTVKDMDARAQARKRAGKKEDG